MINKTLWEYFRCFIRRIIDEIMLSMCYLKNRYVQLKPTHCTAFSENLQEQLS